MKTDSTSKPHSLIGLKTPQDFIGILQRRIGESKGRRCTLEDLSKALGFKSPRAVAMLLDGSRGLTPETILKLGHALGLNSLEQRYLELRALESRLKKRGRPLTALKQELSALDRNHADSRELAPETFSPISEWYHLVIKQMISSPHFKEDPVWISKRLKGKVTPEQVVQCLKLLEKNGFVERDSKGKLIERELNAFSKIDYPSKAVRRHQRQMMERASTALDEQALFERECVSLTFLFDRERLQEAKSMIREFRDRFNERFSAETSNTPSDSKKALSVYQLSLQFFGHSEEF